jgi:hypothetical protein
MPTSTSCRTPSITATETGDLDNPSSVVSWENHTFRSVTAFVAELPAGALTQAAVGRFAHAVVTVAGVR